MRALLGALLVFSSLISLARAQDVKLEKVEVSENGIRIETSQPVKYSKSRLTDPDRILIELPGVRCAPKELPGKGTRLAGVRIGQFVENPPVTRVVLDLNDPAFEPKVLVEGPQRVREKPKPVEAPQPAVKAPRPARSPRAQRPDTFMDNFQSWFVLGGMIFAGLTLCVALYRIRWMRNNEASVRAYGAQEAKRVEERLDTDLQMLRRRLSAVEAKLAQIQEEPRGGGEASTVEEIKELRAVLRSLNEADLLPKS